jgi:hypothetical protein
MDKAISPVPFKISGTGYDPRDIDYDIKGYHKRRTIVKGELVKVEYFKNFDGTTYSDLVVEEARTYNRDAIGIIQTRDIKITWYLINNTIGCIKEWTKYYNSDEAIQEGIDRRSNMIGVAKTTLLNLLAESFGVPTNQQYAFDLLTSVKSQMEVFKDGHTQPLRDAINSSTKAYLNPVIKTAIITELTF